MICLDFDDLSETKKRRNEEEKNLTKKGEENEKDISYRSSCRFDDVGRGWAGLG